MKFDQESQKRYGGTSMCECFARTFCCCCKCCYKTENEDIGKEGFGDEFGRKSIEPSGSLANES